MQSTIFQASQKPMGEQDEEEEDDEDEPELVTPEKFYRDLMGLSDNNDDDDNENGDSDGQKKSPKKKGKNPKYANAKRPHDNRDSLPFLVQVMTPPEEPYESAKLTKKQRKMAGNNNSKSSSSDNLGIVGETLGEFAFEKHTSAGDKIVIDDQVYLVQRAKCQYKYAGAQKFVMVRKILQVKPMQRAMQEEYIMRQWNAAPAPESE